MAPHDIIRKKKAQRVNGPPTNWAQDSRSRAQLILFLGLKSHPVKSRFHVKRSGASRFYARTVGNCVSETRENLVGLLESAPLKYYSWWRKSTNPCHHLTPKNSISSRKRFVARISTDFGDEEFESEPRKLQEDWRDGAGLDSGPRAR